MRRRRTPSRDRSFFHAGAGRGALLWLLGVGLVLLFVWQQAAVDRLVLRLEREQDRKTRLSSDVNALRFEVESLAGHVQVAGEAGDRLAMIRPDPDQIRGIRFETDGDRVRPVAPGGEPR